MKHEYDFKERLDKIQHDLIEVFSAAGEELKNDIAGYNLLLGIRKEMDLIKYYTDQEYCTQCNFQTNTAFRLPVLTLREYVELQALVKEQTDVTDQVPSEGLLNKITREAQKIQCDLKAAEIWRY